MGVQDSMPRGDDDLLRRVAKLEADMKQTLALAASAASIKQTIVSPSTGSASFSNYTLSTSYSTVASFSFAVPDGFSRALVNAQGSVTSLSNAAAGGEIGYTRVLIGGSAGAEGTAVYPTSSTYPSIPAFAARVLTGLSGGSILIEIQARLRTGPGVAPAGLPASGAVTASALFLS